MYTAIEAEMALKQYRAHYDSWVKPQTVKAMEASGLSAEVVAEVVAIREALVNGRTAEWFLANTASYDRAELADDDEMMQHPRIKEIFGL